MQTQKMPNPRVILTHHPGRLTFILWHYSSPYRYLLCEPFSLFTHTIPPSRSLHSCFSDESSDDDDDDDELELQRELDRIKAERAATQLKREVEEQQAEALAAQDRAIKGNPLVNLDESAGSARVRGCY